jgi:serine/threonine-protein kinase
MFQHVEANPVPPTQINPKMSPEMENIILKAMSADPGDRFQSFSELKNSFLALKLEHA